MIEIKEPQFKNVEGQGLSPEGLTSVESTPNTPNVTTITGDAPVVESVAAQPRESGNTSDLIEDEISDNSNGDVTDSNTWGTAFSNKRQGEIPV